MSTALTDRLPWLSDGDAPHRLLHRAGLQIILILEYWYTGIIVLTFSGPACIMANVKVSFRNKHLDRVENDGSYSAGYSPAIVKAFRRRMQLIRAAVNEQDFYQMKSLHYEKLEGPLAHQRSMRLNDQMRLIVEIEVTESERIIIIVGIEDYH